MKGIVNPRGVGVAGGARREDFSYFFGGGARRQNFSYFFGGGEKWSPRSIIYSTLSRELSGILSFRLKKITCQPSDKLWPEAKG